MQIEINKSFKYKAHGICIGYPWGSKALYGYQAETLKSDNKETLLYTLKEKIKDGSIDSGFGFEKVVGVIMDLKTITTLYNKEDNKEYINTESEIIDNYIEDINQKDKDFFMKYFLDNDF